jgi:competence ComEA-like helix-hairpin-helix protein
VSDLRARGEPSGSWTDGYGAAAACLGVWLLAGTALSGLMSAGPPFSVVGLPDAASEREEGTREALGRRPAAGPAPAGGHAETLEVRREALPPQTLDINRADVMALQALPGVGPALARRIVAHRETHGPFRKPADLLQVSGVGAKRYARLHGLIGTAEAP